MQRHQGWGNIIIQEEYKMRDRTHSGESKEEKQEGAQAWWRERIPAVNHLELPCDKEPVGAGHLTRQPRLLAWVIPTLFRNEDSHGVFP
jgi:hypothetical protein